MTFAKDSVLNKEFDIYKLVSVKPYLHRILNSDTYNLKWNN